MFFVNNVMDKIGVRNMSTDDETQGFLRSVTPTLPRMGGILSLRNLVSIKLEYQ